jgi:hypothetical protein
MSVGWWVVVVALFCDLSITSESCNCRFASQFSVQSLLTSQEEQNDFLSCVMEWEGNFHQIAYNQNTGMTYDGYGINYTTGQLQPDTLHFWSAPSKESLHLMVIARAIWGNTNAQKFLSPSNLSNGVPLALSILTRKLNSIDQWNSKYPGFGGYLAWFYNYDSGIVPADGWSNAVPSLDNGEMIWGWYAVQVALERFTKGDCGTNCQLAEEINVRVQKYLSLLASTALTIFYENGYFRSVATIENNQITPFQDPENYGSDCDPTQAGAVCYLDDPYEGEMFVFFVDLYATWPDENTRNQIWVNKRAKLQAVNFDTPDGSITVQRGWWFSSHEQWKYLALPYLSGSLINRRVFLNGERARVRNSDNLNVCGLHASVSDVCAPGCVSIPDYLSATGIPEISFQQQQLNTVVTPYGAYPVILANFSVGLTWYLATIQGPRMQNPFGSTEGINISATAISPVVTWDSKITTVASMLGGVAELTEVGLQRDGKYQRFIDVVNHEWERVFKKLEGEHLDFVPPTNAFPSSSLGQFTDCSS